jgi:hypothetical protein
LQVLNPHILWGVLAISDQFRYNAIGGKHSKKQTSGNKNGGVYGNCCLGVFEVVFEDHQMEILIS